MMKGIEELAKDFFENENVCSQPKELKIGEEVYIIDQELIDPENDFYALIPCVVAAVYNSTRIPGRKYYWFIAKGSKLDDTLNDKEEVLAGGNVLRYYKFLEHTSPYIFTIKETIER